MPVFTESSWSWLKSTLLQNTCGSMMRFLEKKKCLINDIHVNSFAAVARCDALRFLSVYAMALSCAFV